MTNPRSALAKSKVAVFGAGTMGHAIAAVFSMGGFRVCLFDISNRALDRAQKDISTLLHTLERQSALPPGVTTYAAQKRIHYATSMDIALQSAKYVVETVTEDPRIKTKLYEDVAQKASTTAVLLSNTSYLDIFPLVPESLRNRTLIAHWYSPPYIIDLVDIVAGQHVPDSTTQRVAKLFRELGKAPTVLEQFLPGFIANRIQWAITLEALRLMDRGIASAAQIDHAIIHGLSLRLPILGHLGRADFGGLDIMRRALANGTYTLPERTVSSSTLEAILATGRKGVQSGAGFYGWSDGAYEEFIRARDERLIQLRQFVKEIGNLIDDRECIAPTALELERDLVDVTE